MIDQPVICLKGVSKKYQLYESLKHRFYEALHPRKKTYHREFWALRNIDLEIPAGATLGILGVNGSGKSTLLQIICSILKPTTGTVDVRGKVAALIELGAGFNRELTGRENAEINCAILGLDAKTVRTRLPEIEAFADIGEFFDQPVKTYSSGMFMRVAFAVAISVDPDILVIDEALAVGDARFQQKCFRKFREFQEAGKTIILVTHDRTTLPRLCSMGVLLSRGRLLRVGAPKEVTDHYSYVLTHGDEEAPPDSIVAEFAGQPQAEDPGPRDVPASVKRELDRFLLISDRNDHCVWNPNYNKNEFCYGVGGAAIIDYLVIADDVVNPAEIRSGTVMDVYVKIRFDEHVENPLVGISVKTREGTLIYGTHSGWLGTRLASRDSGEGVVYKFSVPMNLGTDDWFIDLAVARSQAEVMHNREGVLYIRTTAPRNSTGILSLNAAITEL